MVRNLFHYYEFLKIEVSVSCSLHGSKAEFPSSAVFLPYGLKHQTAYAWYYMCAKEILTIQTTYCS